MGYFSMGLLALLLAGTVAGAAPEAKPSQDLLTGNMGTSYLKWMLSGRKGQEPDAWSASYLASLRRAGVTGVEDYITFCALEPERDRPDWHHYRLNYERVRAAGMRYGVYPWLHFPPQWFTESPEYVPYVCLEHGQPTYSTSIWAPSTLAIYDRFYAQLRKEFGDGVADIHASMPADYGEVGFPVGMSSWLVPQEHKHAGFWCGDRYARADFRARMADRYRTLDALNRAWGTRFENWEALEYPPLTAPDTNDPAARRRWLDFVGWYADSQTEFARKAFAIIRKHFPTTPVQVKLGYGGEHVEYGVDNTGVVRACAQDKIIVRSTHGKLPPFFYKRFSTPARFYGAQLLTEPPSDVNREEEVRRLFNDATNLSRGYFDYPKNILNAADIFQTYLPWVEGERAHIRVAFLFPTSDHRLRHRQRLPQTLYDQAEALRDITDYDLVDENLVRDGALKDHRLLALFEGNWLEQETLDAIAAWVRDGGTLVLSDFGAIANIAGDTRTYRALLGRLPERTGDASVLELTGAVPPRMLLDVGAPDDDRFLGNGWWNREKQGAMTSRWTKEAATLRVPVDPTKDLTVTVFVGQTERITKPPRLLVNGQDAGELRFVEGAASVTVPATLLKGNRAVFTVAAHTWQPSAVIPGNKDGRFLGVWVDRIEVVQKGAESAPLQPAPGFRADARKVVRDLSQRVGKGRVIFFPFGPEEGAAYRDLIRHLIYEESAPLHPRVDTESDNVQTAVLESKILFLNGTAQPITKRVSLRPFDFEGVAGPVPPARQVTLNLLPHSIAAIRRTDGKVLAPQPEQVRPLWDLWWWNPNSHIGEHSLNGGTLRVRVAGSDPYLTHGRTLHLDTARYPILVLRVRTDIAGARLYWTTDKHPNLEDQTSHAFKLPADGAWHEVRVDLRGLPRWTGSVQQIRIDLEKASGYAEFQAIHLEEAK